MKERFEKFLRDNGAYNKFVTALRYLEHMSFDEYFEYFENQDYAYECLVFEAFKWEDTTDGADYWIKLDKMWSKYVEYINTETKRITIDDVEYICTPVQKGSSQPQEQPVEKQTWRDDENATTSGYYINMKSNVFATEKQAKSALAMARISQIIKNDSRFGGEVTDEEWNDSNIGKSVICREKSDIITTYLFSNYCFLAFHTNAQRDLFLQENEDLVRDYLMID
jgi:hypothetical protein